MKIQQQLDSATNDYKTNKDNLEHWTSEHDKLQLEDVECV